MLKKFINSYYNQKVEDVCTRILYFFNTLDTYFLLAGVASFIIVFPILQVNIITLLLSVSVVVVTARIADFYPTFVIFTMPVLIALGIVLNLALSSITMILFVNIVFFFIIQFAFMGIPDSIVARDIRVPFIKIYNSLFTVAPTTVSFSMSVFFSFYLSFFMAAGVSCRTARDYAWLAVAAIALLIGALISRLMLPKNLFSKFHKPDIRDNAIFKRVVILNIDGVRKDIFDSLHLPAIGRLVNEGTSHASGLETVYRALTNSAFASILTGTTPKFHGVSNNNFGQSIKTEGLPDIVPTVLYGSMHVKHFCKKAWQTRIVSLPTYSVYNSDDIMIKWLKEDLLAGENNRLFIADFSEADFLAHAYGSTSKQYREALRRTDQRIGDFIDWIEANGIADDTGIIVCSDHGVAAIDHSYLIADSEKYVPFLMYGKGIKKDFKIERSGKIMDICCTVSYLLGVRYPRDCRGQVFTEALQDSDLESEKEVFVSRFNQLKYDAEAKHYRSCHSEIYDGDRLWWEQCIAKFVRNGMRNYRVLDIGCGTGFIGERFAAMAEELKEFVCLDTSKNMIEQAKESLGKYSNYSFATNLNDIKGQFDVITASSLFHHIVYPEKLAATIDKLLVGGGILIGSHEPNKMILKNKLFCVMAALYKKIGGGVSINDEIVQQFNELLAVRFSRAPRVCREEILQMVEYHSPLEQYDRDIDLKNGFVPDDFFKTYFPKYEVNKFETYTTFFHRPYLSRHKKVQLLLVMMYHLFFKQGNLFRFVLRKNKT